MATNRRTRATNKNVGRQEKEQLPAWGVATIAVIVTLIVVVFVWDMWRRNDGEKMATDWNKTWERMDTTVKRDMERMEGKTVTAGTTKTTATTNDLYNWLNDYDAINCTITNLTTGAVTIYETDENFEKVRMENAAGGLIVDKDWTYVWNNSTMTGTKVKVDVTNVQEELVASLPATTTTDNYEVACESARGVDTRRPSGVVFDERITVTD